MLLHTATRKGYLGFRRKKKGDWRVERTALLGDPVNQILPVPADGRLYAALDLGHFGVKLRVSEDGGRSFRDLPAPAFAPDSSKKGPSVNLLWCLEAGEEPGELLTGTIPGALFRSPDGGESWTLNQALWDQPGREKWFGGGYPEPGIHSILVGPAPGRLLVAVSCGGVWISEDRGASFRPATKGMFAEYVPPESREDPDIQDPHRICRSAADPDRLWCQHHNGFFRSDDGGETWTSLEVTPSSFGFAVEAHPEDRDIAWTVPLVKDEHRIPVDGRMVVARTTDGGRSWTAGGRGLPQQHSFAVVYRHGLAIHPESRVLAMATTTGALWVSEDLGDSWELVTADLAPVYAVRFEPER